MTDNNTLQTPILFIVGRGRSGTWLMRTILNAHSHISVAPESLFLLNLFPKYKNVKNWDKKRINQFVGDLFLDEKIGLWWNIDRDETLKILLDYRHHLHAYSDVAHKIYQIYADASGKKGGILVADKNPEYTRFISVLLQIFPSAKFLALVRDPRSNIASFRNVKFDLKHSVSLSIRWNQYNNDLLRFQRRFSDKILCVKYEDLIAAPTQALQRIENFLEVDGLVSLQHTFFKNTPNLYSFNQKIGSPLDQSRIEPWTRELGDSDVTAINCLCAQTASRFGYRISQAKLRFGPLLLALPYILFGALINGLEVAYFGLPLHLKHYIMKLYRRKTKILSTADQNSQ